MADRFETHGNFSWCELLTRNVEESKKFYQDLFGWTMEDVLKEGVSYTVLRANGKPVGGIMKMPPQVPAEAPPYWGTYVTVDDVDAIVTKLQELGGKVLVPPMDVPDARFCVFQDPHGAVLSVINYSKKPE